MSYPVSPVITDIAHTIQLAVAPAFLLAAIGGFLSVLAGRLNRVVDRSRTLESAFTPADHPDHARQVWELRLIDRRIKLATGATFLCTASAILICLVVAGLFVASMTDLAFVRIVSIAFIVAMALLIAGLMIFLIEVRISLHGIRVRDELLERERR